MVRVELFSSVSTTKKNLARLHYKRLESEKQEVWKTVLSNVELPTQKWQVCC